MTEIIDHDHARVGAWMQAHGSGTWREGTTCIGLERDGQLVAGTMYDYFNGASIFAHIAIAGRVSREWLWFIFYYPFVQVGATVILGLIAQDNVRSQRLVRKMGFVLQMPLPDCDVSGNLLVYTMHRTTCRYLRRHTNGQTRPPAAA